MSTFAKDDDDAVRAVALGKLERRVYRDIGNRRARAGLERLQAAAKGQRRCELDEVIRRFESRPNAMP